MAKRTSNSSNNKQDAPMTDSDEADQSLAEDTLKVDRVFQSRGWSKGQTPEVTQMVERVVGEACVLVNLRREENSHTSLEAAAVDGLGRGTKDVQESMLAILRDAFTRGLAASVARGIQAMSLSDENPALAAYLRHTLEVACCTPHIDMDVRHELQRCDVEAMNNGIYLDPSLMDEKKVDADGSSTAMPHGHVFIVPVEVHDLNEEQDTSHFDIKISPLCLQEVAGAVARGMAQDLGAPILGAYILPRFITHEELSDVSMQTLHDLPESVLCRARTNPDKLSESPALLNCASDEEHSPMSDVPLLASTRVLYLVGVNWSDEPNLVNKMQYVWDKGVPDALREMLSEIISSGSASHLHQFNVVGADSFFYGLRAGVEYQRGTVFLDSLQDLLGRMDVTPESCFFEVVTARMYGMPLCPVLRIHGPWLDELGEVPWPMLVHEMIDDQFDELHRIAKSLGMRPMSEYIVVRKSGVAA